MKKEKQKKQKRPNPILYFIFSSIIRIYNHIKVKLELRGERPKGPCLILANHNSSFDWQFIISACGFRRVTFMISNRFFVLKGIGAFLRMLSMIPKHQFAADLTSMRKVKEVSERGGIIYIAPEGTVYASGRLGFISVSTAKFVKFLKIPVYATKIEGASLGSAKWSKKRHRNKVRLTTTLLLTKEDVLSLSKEEILQKINDALNYDEYSFAKEENIRIKGDDLAEGFERMFYKCPVCGEEFRVSSAGSDVVCSACGSKATIGSDFRFRWELGPNYKEKQVYIQKEYDNFTAWYEYQLSEVKKEILSPDFKLEDEVEFATDVAGSRDFVKVGKGVMTLSRSGWDYRGTFNGKPFADHDDLPAVFLATLSAGKFFELPYKDGRCRVYYTKNGNKAMKWHLASRAISELLESGELK